jgi:hypothetical protein
VVDWSIGVGVWKWWSGRTCLFWGGLEDNGLFMLPVCVMSERNLVFVWLCLRGTGVVDIRPFHCAVFCCALGIDRYFAMIRPL